MGLFTKIFGTHSDRELKKIMPIWKEIKEELSSAVVTPIVKNQPVEASRALKFR